jgi:23S rRNA (adenine2503-C2)-methyltransferase
MELVEKIKSVEDKTVKYIFKLADNLIIETTYIDNNSGKDIICVASQTMCGMGCTFCHLTDSIGKLTLRNLTTREIVESVERVYADMNLKDNNRLLLISYMGCGEPLMNIDNVFDSVFSLKYDYKDIRFGLSTMLPKKKFDEFFLLTKRVAENKLSLKVHLSLHYTNDTQRNKFMPSALNIKPSIAALEFYKELTGNPVEIHYTMIKDTNDKGGDALDLISLLKNRNIPVKFLRFNSKETNKNEGAEMHKIRGFKELLNANDIKTEYYEPPGKDVGASCGQFLMDKYEQYNKKESKNEKAP